MFPRIRHRTRHYALLVSTWALLCLPNLGGPSLWDIDEGNNATAGYEMSESGNWIVPTFNNQLRKDKPALLYWLQATAYAAFGANEFSARLPSALAALVAVLATYELGRLLAGKGVGLLAGLVLASAVGFGASAHFANPDALLNACTVLTLLLFWCHYRRGGSRWFVATGLTTGLGMLAKGPVGVVLPVAVALLFLFWKRQLRRLGDPRLLGAAVVFVAVAAPWYVWVGLETKGEWLRGFFAEHNVNRFRSTMENHGGSLLYYPLALIAGFAPWSVFLAVAGWYAVRRARGQAGGESSGERGLRRAGGVSPRRDGIVFLAAWVAVYGLFFTASRTKLPNYILPLYPAVAILTALFLDHWRRGIVRPPAWVMPVSLGCLALMGAGIALGLLTAAGVIEVPFLRGRQLPGLAAWAWLGAVLVLGAGVASWCVRRGRPAEVIRVLALTAAGFAGALGAWGAGAVDRYKAPRSLARCLPADQTRREVRVASYVYFQPSLVFYCRREVFRLKNEQEVAEFLQGPLPSYLFVPAGVWGQLRAKLDGPYRVVGSHYDLYDGCEVVVVTNE
jgi:4-amino-4-deoxy-L-arabinose transferase-like glycosyltransferase